MTRNNKTPGARATPRNEKSLTTRARQVKDNCLARASRSVARKIIAAYEAHLAPFDLSVPQFVVLLTIASARNDTLAAIAEEADIDPSTLTRNLQVLERNGLVEIAAIETDQRKRSVWLTETGARRLEAAIPSWIAAQKDVEARLGPGLLPALLRAEKAL